MRSAASFGSKGSHLECKWKRHLRVAGERRIWEPERRRKLEEIEDEKREETRKTARGQGGPQGVARACKWAARGREDGHFGEQAEKASPRGGRGRVNNRMALVGWRGNKFGAKSRLADAMLPSILLLLATCYSVALAGAAAGQPAVGCLGSQLSPVVAAKGKSAETICCAGELARSLRVIVSNWLCPAWLWSN